MDKFFLDQVVKQLKEQGVEFDVGLSDDEIQNIETKNEFFFPPDLKAFLQYAVPISIEENGYTAYFPKWRSNPDTLVKTFQENILQGIIWQLENDDTFWLKRWGTRPFKVSDAITIVRRDYETAPIVVPVFSHRCIPSRPKSSGNPVFSIVGVDIIIYGTNLLDYLKQEFRLDKIAVVRSKPVQIEFWDDFLSENK